MPVGNLLLSAIIAYAASLLAYEWQDRFLTNKLKIDTINKTFMGFQNVQGTLLSIKENYAKELTDNPLQRACSVPQLIYSFTPLEINYEHLIQVISSDDDNLHGNPWVHVASYISLQDQYSQLNKIIQERNLFDSKIKEKLVLTLGRNYFSFEEITSVIDTVSLQKYIQLTELVILHNDNLIISVDDFLRNFPRIARNKMKNNISKNYKMIMAYKNDSDRTRELQKRTIPLDLALTSFILNIPQDTIQKMLCDHSFAMVTHVEK